MHARVPIPLILAAALATASTSSPAPRAAPAASAQATIPLVPVDALIGGRVATREGEPVGELRFVTLSLEQGTVSNLIVDTTGTVFHADSGDLLIVPWHAAELSEPGGSSIVAATGRHIANAPRLKARELDRLTEPVIASYVVDYWKPGMDMAALEGRREPAPRREPQRPPSPSRPTPRQPPSPVQLPAVPPGEANDRDPVMLVGQEVVAEATPPMYQLSRQLRGARVVDARGATLGEIHRILIDTETGDAAFAIVEETSSGRAPVPLQALEWTAERTTRLTADADRLQPDPALTDRDGPVSRRALAELYRRFGAEAYWLRAGPDER